MAVSLKASYRTVALIGAIGLAAHLGSLYLFALVGRFDQGADSELLGSYDIIQALGLTVMMCAISISATVIYARRIIPLYSGNRRVLLYSYPDGREKTYVLMHRRFYLEVLIATLFASVAGSTLFLTSELVVPLVEDPALPFTNGGDYAQALSLSAMSVLIAVIAGSIGLTRRSPLTAVVASVVLVALLANGAAGYVLQAGWIVLLALIVLTVLASLLFLYNYRMIRSEEIL